MISRLCLGWPQTALAALALNVAVSASAAAEALDYQVMTLQNGWQRFSLAVAAPSAALDSENVVHLKGAMLQTGPANQSPFILPKKLRPNRTLYIPISLINGRPGRVVVLESGNVLIEATNFDDAQGFTSLEGVTYSRN
jgi:hypothetical protein